MASIRIVVVDGHEIDRAGLASLLQSERDLEVVAMVASGNDLLHVVREMQPDVVLVDYTLEDPSGLEVCEKLKELDRGLPVVILSGSHKNEAMYRSLLAGANAFLRKDVAAADLKRTLREVVRVQTAPDARMVARALRWASTYGDHPQGVPLLSAREIEALRLVADGCGGDEIAERMGISQNTVKTYLRRALNKLGCHTRAEAAAEASRRGMI